MENLLPPQENSGETKLLGEIHQTLSLIEEITAQGDEPSQDEYVKFQALALRFKNENKEFSNILKEKFEELLRNTGNTPQKNPVGKMFVEAFKQFESTSTAH